LSRSLLGVKQTWAGAVHMSAFDPKRTSNNVVNGLVRRVTRLPHNRNYLRSGDCVRTHHDAACTLLNTLRRWGASMHRLSIAAVAAVSTIAFAQFASAADLPRNTPAPPELTVYNWTGWYVGGNFGYGWGGSTGDDRTGVDLNNSFGGVGGL